MNDIQILCYHSLLINTIQCTVVNHKKIVDPNSWKIKTIDKFDYFYPLQPICNRYDMESFVKMWDVWNNQEEIIYQFYRNSEALTDFGKYLLYLFPNLPKLSFFRFLDHKFEYFYNYMLSTNFSEKFCLFFAFYLLKNF